MTGRRSRKRVLTTAEERTIRRAVAAGSTDREAAAAAGVSARRFYLARDHELADIPRNKRGPRNDRVYGPPPEPEDLPIEEIYRRAAELRAERWSEDEAAARWNPGFSGPVAP